MKATKSAFSRNKFVSIPENNYIGPTDSVTTILSLKLSDLKLNGRKYFSLHCFPIMVAKKYINNLREGKQIFKLMLYKFFYSPLCN